jgi:hypothetical protein
MKSLHTAMKAAGAALARHHLPELDVASHPSRPPQPTRHLDDEEADAEVERLEEHQTLCWAKTS